MDFEIQIKNIKEKEFRYSAHNLNSINDKHLSLGFKLGFKVNPKKNCFTIKLVVIYNYDNPSEEGEQLELLYFSIATKFKIKNLKKIIRKEENDDNKFEMPDAIMITMVGAAISTIRGMMVYKLSGTLLSEYYLPLINIPDFLDIKSSQNVNEDSAN
ncbi:MAG: hypothetical protein JKY22_03025 [Flavobacteriaceae bacterium]|nr:hypothetical protein [Flavobacteriaceae bacterium]